MSSTNKKRTLTRRWSWVSLIIAGVVIGLDQFTKALAIAHVSMAAHHLAGPFGLQLTFNTGSAFSLFTGSTIPLMVIDGALIVLLIVLGGRSLVRTVQVGIGLMLGGAIGNFCDRIFRHHDRGVIDFVTLSHWPTFNLADSAITVGALVVLIGLLVQNREGTDTNGTT